MTKLSPSPMDTPSPTSRKDVLSPHSKKTLLSPDKRDLMLPHKRDPPTPYKSLSSSGKAPMGIPIFVKPTTVKQRTISDLGFDNGNQSESVRIENPYSNLNLNLNLNVNDIAIASVPISDGVTYGAQSELPPLPVPTLEETMAKFLKHLEALEVDQDPEERRNTELVVSDFLRDLRAKGGGNGSLSESESIQNQIFNSEASVNGPVLQELLLDYDKHGRNSGAIGSYVEEFWSDAYLAPDSSVVLNLNPYFLLEESPDPKMAGNQIRRAASLCFASVKMASQLRNKTLKPDHFRGRALCMNQFRALFGASRVPKLRSRDTIATHKNSNHVAVMCRNQLFSFQALWPDTGDVAVDEVDLVSILEAIREHVTKVETRRKDGETEQKYLDSVSALGVLTSLARNQWAKAREEMIDHSSRNADSFKIIDSALFVLVLDDYIPKTKHEAAANMLHGSYEIGAHKLGGDVRATEYQSGSCTNRWYDKLQIIVTADGGAGINFEHSAVDGHTALRFVSDIYADTVISFAQSITKLVHAHKGLIPSVIDANVRRVADVLDNQGRKPLDVSPKKINFDLSEAMKRKIYFAETALGDQILASDTYILEFTDYGKQFITFNRLSPDSYVQMSMMLAYYRLYGKMVCAYEPVLTKAFFHGRTEAMRPATMEAKHLCEVFCNPSSSTREKLGALRNATITHSRLVKECAQGKGVDRHLFALKCIAEKNGLPIPEFFRSESWRKLNHTTLSTSNCGNPSLALFGFGPVVSDGYGIGYIIKDSRLHYAICSKHRQTTRYALTLEIVLREMASLLEPVSNTKVSDTNNRSLSTIPSMHMVVSNESSYGDLWGENSFQSTIDEGRPYVIHETAEQRWNTLGNGDAVTEKTEDFLSPPIKAPLNDVVTPTTPVITAIPEDMRKLESKRRERRGSNDLMPIRPDRRSSTSIIRMDSRDLAELVTLDDEQDTPTPKKDKFKLYKYLEEINDDDLQMNESSGFNESAGLSDSTDLTERASFSEPISLPLNDESPERDNTPLPIMSSITEGRRKSASCIDVRGRTLGGKRRDRRGSNDLMPIRPDRRTSVNTFMVDKSDLTELLKLDDDASEENLSRMEMFNEENGDARAADDH